MSSQLFRHGDLVRYGAGSTALMYIQRVYVYSGENVRYYGKQCMGGSYSASHEKCIPASQEDHKTWFECEEWRKP